MSAVFIRLIRRVGDLPPARWIYAENTKTGYQIPLPHLPIKLTDAPFCLPKNHDAIAEWQHAPNTIKLRRLKPTDAKTTEGCWYLAEKQYQQEYEIQDDRGGSMYPMLNAFEHWDIDLGPSTLDEMTEPKYEPCTREEFHTPARLEDTIIQPTATKETQPMKIENVILINDRRADSYTDDQILEFVKAQEYLIESLDKIKTESAAIKRLKAKHQANIGKLLAILDARTPDEAA